MAEECSQHTYAPLGVKKHVLPKSLRGWPQTLLEPPEQYEAAARLVAHILYPPLVVAEQASRKKCEKSEKYNKRAKRKRRKFVSVLLTKAFLPGIREVLNDYNERDVAGRKQAASALLKTLLHLWGKGLLRSVNGAARFSTYENAPSTYWGATLNSYLVALCFIRQLRAPKGRSAKPMSKKRAIWLAKHCHPTEWIQPHKRRTLEGQISDRRQILPLLCGALYALSTRRSLALLAPQLSAADHLGALKQPPTSSEWISCILEAQETVIGAAHFFEKELSEGVNELLDAAAFQRLPGSIKFNHAFPEPSAWLSLLTKTERRIAGLYSSRKYAKDLAPE